MRDERGLNGIRGIWFSKTTKKWTGSVPIHNEESTESQLRMWFIANSEEELLDKMCKFKEIERHGVLYSRK